jgi:hypothetical protein
VIYELHVGTFTPGGTFDAAIERLDRVPDLGVDIVELMPVASLPGIALCKARPELTDARLDRVRARWGDDDRLIVVSRGRLRMAANLGAVTREVPAEGTDRTSAMLAASKAGIKSGSGVIQLPPGSFARLLT